MFDTVETIFSETLSCYCMICKTKIVGGTVNVT